MKNILIVNSFFKQNKPFLSLFKDLAGDFNFFVWSPDDYFLKRFEGFALSRLNKRIYLGPVLDRKINFLFFLVLLPVFYLKYCFDLIVARSLEKIDRIVCLGTAEKIIFTPLALLLGFGAVWLEEPQASHREEAGFLVFLLKLFSRKVKIIAFTGFTKSELVSLGFREKNIENVYLGILPEKTSRQDNIFFSLAKAEKSPAFFRHFTLGTVADLNNQGQMEDLLKTVKTGAAVVPDLQLVVIGSGERMRNFSWLARKMEIEDKVWFVGEQEYFKKWFDNFNVFLSVARQPTMFDLETILEAMSAGLPVLAFAHKNLEDLVISGETGFLTLPEVPALAQKVIELGQNKRLVRALSDNARKTVLKYFSRDRQLGEIRRIFNL